MERLINRCPVCHAGSMRINTDWDHKSDGYHRVYAICRNCGARTASFPTQREVQDAVNTGMVSKDDEYQMNMFEALEGK